MTVLARTNSNFPYPTSLKNTYKSWREQKYGHGSQRDPKPRCTLLARASRNLTDRSVCTGTYSTSQLLPGFLRTVGNRKDGRTEGLPTFRRKATNLVWLMDRLTVQLCMLQQGHLSTNKSLLFPQAAVMYIRRPLAPLHFKTQNFLKVGKQLVVVCVRVTGCDTNCTSELSGTPKIDAPVSWCTGLQNGPHSKINHLQILFIQSCMVYLMVT
jgi:hypothetical protein